MAAPAVQPNDVPNFPSITGNLCRALKPVSTISGFILGRRNKPEKDFSNPDDMKPFCSQPFILPGQISHTRFTPLFSRFVYSHIYVGIPINSEGFEDALITLDDQPWWKRKWLYVAASDHLERTAENISLHAKLQKYLGSQGLDSAMFPYCYLTTTPRFLAMPRFNPVSVWFLYSADQKLSAMIVEVHNISQERRSFLLYDGFPVQGSDDKDHPRKSNRRNLDSRVRYTHQKDFHSSEFNGRDGTYTPNAVNPMDAPRNGRGSLDASITMKSKEGEVMVVARMKSRGKPMESGKLSFPQRMSLFCFCLHASLMPFPHMIYQYLRLRLVLKLKPVARPTPNRNTVARASTRDEIFLEHVFRRYLKARVLSSSKAAMLHYVSPEETRQCPKREEIFVSERTVKEGTAAEATELRVLTPAFFSRMIHYRSIREALEGENANVHEDNQTAAVEDFELIREILGQNSSKHVAEKVGSNPFAQLLLITLRFALNKGKRPPTSRAAYSTTLSDLDSFALRECNANDTIRYLWASFRILLAQRMESMRSLWMGIFVAATLTLFARGQDFSITNNIDLSLAAVTIAFGSVFTIGAKLPAF